MARLTFEEWWDSVSIEGVQANTLDNFSLSKQAVIVGFCKSAWEACESALCAEQADAVASAVAGAYLDAAGHWPAYIANPDKDAFIQSWIECSCGQAKANGTLRYNTIWGEHIRRRTPADAKAALERRDGQALDKRILADRDATIARLTAELDVAKREGAICHCEKCSLERIDAAKGGPQP